MLSQLNAPLCANSSRIECKVFYVMGPRPVVLASLRKSVSEPLCKVIIFLIWISTVVSAITGLLEQVNREILDTHVEGSGRLADPSQVPTRFPYNRLNGDKL